MIKKIYCYGISFLIPLAVISLALASHGIWWGSDTTILASDGFHQYVIFATTLRNILHGQDSIFYSFSSGLGVNFYALISYYLGSFFSPLTYFFNLTSMPDALYLFTLLKIGTIGLTTFTSLSIIYKKVSSWLLLSLSTAFALMSFSISQIEINMWLDVFMLIPLIILGLHRLLNQRKLFLYFTSLSILFIQNYYFGFMTAIFISLYFLVQLSWSGKHWRRKFADFTIVSVLSGLTSSVMLLPTYLDLTGQGETFTELSSLFTENSWYLDFFAKTMVASYDTTQFDAIPMIYVGLLPLILALTFFLVRTIPWRVKLSYGALLTFIIASFYLEPLDLFWQGMHAPNMFLHRYAWVLSVLIIYMAAETLERMDDLSLKKSVFPFFILGSGFLATSLLTSHYDFIGLEQIGLTFTFLLAYLIIVLSYYSKQIDKKLYIIFTLFFTIFELGLNSFYQLDGIYQEWNFPSRSGYAEDLRELDSLVKWTQEQDSEFFRTERLLSQTGNDSMKYAYNGISQFSSVRNRHSSQLLDKLGFRSDGTNLNLRYQNNTLIADSLFAVTYNLHNQPINKYGFRQVQEENGIYLYHNAFASSLALLTDDIYTDIDMTVNTLDNQTDWLNHLSGLNLSYFSKLDSFTTPAIDENSQLIHAQSQPDGSSQVEFTINIPANKQVYLSLPHVDSSNPDSDRLLVQKGNEQLEYTTDDAFSLLDLGYFEQEQWLTITLIFPDAETVSFSRPNIYALDIPAYEQAMSTINQREITAKTVGNQVILDYTSPKASSILLTLPYDKGWSAKLNNETITVKQAQGGLLLLDVPEGDGQLVLTFIPYGFKLGVVMSLLGLISFLLYYKLTKT